VSLRVSRRLKNRYLSRSLGIRRDDQRGFQDRRIQPLCHLSGYRNPYFIRVSAAWAPAGFWPPEPFAHICFRTVGDLSGFVQRTWLNASRDAYSWKAVVTSRRACSILRMEITALAGSRK
jgi:hypothetical protein